MNTSRLYAMPEDRRRLIDNNDITIKAKIKAEEIITIAEEKAKQLKIGTYEYMDSILFNFQEKMEELNGTYFADMFNSLENTFSGINETLQSNRDEIKQMAFEVHDEVEADKEEY